MSTRKLSTLSLLPGIFFLGLFLQQSTAHAQRVRQPARVVAPAARVVKPAAKLRDKRAVLTSNSKSSNSTY